MPLMQGFINLISYSDALGHCAEDKMCLKVIQEMDGVRLLWSLLKNPSPKVMFRTRLFSFEGKFGLEIFFSTRYIFRFKPVLLGHSVPASKMLQTQGTW